MTHAGRGALRRHRLQRGTGRAAVAQAGERIGRADGAQLLVLAPLEQAEADTRHHQQDHRRDAGVTQQACSLLVEGLDLGLVPHGLQFALRGGALAARLQLGQRCEPLRLERLHFQCVQACADRQDAVGLAKRGMRGHPGAQHLALLLRLRRAVHMRPGPACGGQRGRGVAGDALQGRQLGQRAGQARRVRTRLLRPDHGCEHLLRRPQAPLRDPYSRTLCAQAFHHRPCLLAVRHGLALVDDGQRLSSSAQPDQIEHVVMQDRRIFQPDGRGDGQCLAMEAVGHFRRVQVTGVDQSDVAEGGGLEQGGLVGGQLPGQVLHAQVGRLGAMDLAGTVEDRSCLRIGAGAERQGQFGQHEALHAGAGLHRAFPVAGQAGGDAQATEGLRLVLDGQVGLAQQRFGLRDRHGRRIAAQLQAAGHLAGPLGAGRNRALGPRGGQAQQHQAQQAGQQAGGEGSRHERSALGQGARISNVNSVPCRRRTGSCTPLVSLPTDSIPPSQPHDRAQSHPPAHRRPAGQAGLAPGVSLTTMPSANAWKK